VTEIAVDTLTALLRHFDWAVTGRNENLYEVWSYQGDDVVVPLDPNRGDFAALLQRAQDLLQRRYGRLADEVIETLTVRTQGILDATRWHKATPVGGGLIPWEQGESLYVSARQQLAAAAKSAREVRRYHGNSGAHVARRFLENSFMGQTSIGSFIITAYTPSNTRFFLSQAAEETASSKGHDLLGEDSITGSDVLDTLESALKAVRSGLDTYAREPRTEVFLDTVSEGVSYEFLQALSSIAATGDTSVEIARQAATDGATPAPVSVEFRAVEAPVMASAATSFAQDPEPQNVTLSGDVTLLSRTEEGQGLNRVIRLNVFPGSRVRKVRVHLDADQYDLAQEAHRIEGGLQVSGVLTREGHLWWIYSATSVSVLRPEELPEGIEEFDDEVDPWDEG
jgi:hypothetical protein